MSEKLTSFKELTPPVRGPMSFTAKGEKKREQKQNRKEGSRKPEIPKGEGEVEGEKPSLFSRTLRIHFIDNVAGRQCCQMGSPKTRKTLKNSPFS